MIIEEEEKEFMGNADRLAKKYSPEQTKENTNTKQSAKIILLIIVFVLLILAVTYKIKKSTFQVHSEEDQSVDIQPNTHEKITTIESIGNLSESNASSTIILPQPYNNEQHANISEHQLSQAKIWKEMLYHSPKIKNQLSNLENQYYIQKYHIDLYPQLPFCIIIPTFNNKLKKRHFRNIRSIINQDYSLLRFVLIDDASVDGTAKEVQQLLDRENTNKIQYKIVKNSQRKYAIANIRREAKQFCLPQQIMMVVDGDDQLIGRQVLKLFNSIFQKEKVWFAYSNALGSNGKLGYSRPYHPDIIEHNQYRKYAFAVSHLRAYYTQLFLKVPEENLYDNHGQYLKSAGDMASIIPMMELAHEKIAYIPQITYFYNMNTGLNVHKDRLSEQRQNNLLIRSRNVLHPLIQLSINIQ